MTRDHATDSSALSIGFVWEGLPMYAAREIRALAAFENLAVTVVGSRPPFSVAEIDQTCPFPIHWYDGATDLPSWADITSRTPDIVFSSGWAFPLCKRLAAEAKQQGRAVVCMADNRLRYTARQFLGAVRFRLGLRRRFDRFFVPGQGGRSLMRFFGVPDGHVREGLYGADAVLFNATTAASGRSKTILFVGQMIERKGVDVLLEGFRASGLESQGGGCDASGMGRWRRWRPRRRAASICHSAMRQRWPDIWPTLGSSSCPAATTTGAWRCTRLRCPAACSPHPARSVRRPN